MKPLSRNPCKYVGPAVLALVDATLTLCGQPESYWSDRSQHDERFPVFGQLLASR